MNIFSVLGESDDDEQPKVVPQKKGKEAPAKTEAAPKKDVGKSTDASKPVKVGNAEAPKSAKGKENSTNASKISSKAPEKAIETEADITTKENNRGGRERGKDPKKIARGEEQDGAARPKRHEHDRRPAGGRGRGEQSRGGRGAFGFGNPAQEAQEAEKDPAAADAVVESPENDDDAAVKEEPESNEPVTRTLDEYMAKRNEARAKVLVDVRPIREVKKTEFVGLVAAKEEETPDIWRSTKQAAAVAPASTKEQRSEAKTSVLDVGFKFEAVRTDRDEREGRDGRGGRGRGSDRAPREGSSRGGGRGGRGDGRGRGRGGGEARGGGASRGAVFNDQDFPTL